MKVKAMAMAACMGISLNASAQSVYPEGRDRAATNPDAGRSAQERMDTERRAGDSWCSRMTGDARQRCVDAEAAASAGNSVSSGTQQPGASGPGTSDKTHPGSGTSRDVGTSSAGG